MAPTLSLKERILKVAGEKFLQQGFYKVSMDSLVAELRTSKSSIYKHFRSKDELVQTLVDQLNEIINRQLEQIVHHDQMGFEDKLLQVTRFSSKLLNLVSPRFLEDLRIHTPAIWDSYQQHQTERERRYYHVLFQQGVREEIIRKDIDLQVLISLYLKLTELAADREQTQQFPYGQDALYEHLTTLFLEGALEP